MYILPVLGSGADADNGMAHLVTFIHSQRHEWEEDRQQLVPLIVRGACSLAVPLSGKLLFTPAKKQDSRMDDDVDEQ